MEIIDTFIPTLKYCSIIINFSNLRKVYLFLDDNDGKYCMYFPNPVIKDTGRKRIEEKYYFDTQKDLSNKVESYVELYGIDNIELEGERGPSTYVYNK